MGAVVDYVRTPYLPALVLVLLVVSWRRICASRMGATAALGLILLVGLLHQVLFGTLAEDAFITFRYAMNLAAGRGPVFNAGEPVEGYSNFLWMVALAGSHRLLGAEIPLTASVLGTLAGLLAVLFTYRLTLEVSDQSRDASLIAALLVAASGSFAAYAPSGMETPLFAAVILLVLLCTLRRSWVAAGALTGLSTMLRPEGALLALPLVGWMMRARTPRRWRNLIAFAASCGALVAPWTLWRWLYYQNLLPNVLLAKEGMDFGHQVGLGFEYLSDFCLANAPMLLLFGVAIAAGAVGRSHAKAVAPRSRRAARARKPATTMSENTRAAGTDPQAASLLAGVLLVFVLFVALVGGDWMPAWRFLAPVVPVAAVLLLGLWHRNVKCARLQTDSIPGMAVFAVAAICLFAQSVWHPNLLPRMRLWQEQLDGLSEIGRWLKRSLPPNTLIAVLSNGALSFYAELPTIDMMGLTDEHIARAGQRFRQGMPGHVAHDWDYVAARKPAVVAFLNGQGFEREPDHQRIKHEFQPDYDMVTFWFPKGTNALGHYVNLLLLRSDEARLAKMLTDAGDVRVVP